VDIERAGRKLRIVPISSKTALTGKFNRLIQRPEAIVGSPDDFTHIDWSHEWHP
jgi:hypothetical protein